MPFLSFFAFLIIGFHAVLLSFAAAAYFFFDY